MSVIEPMAKPKVRLGILGTSLMGKKELREGLEAHALEVVVEETLSGFLSNVDHQNKTDVLLLDLEHADDEDLDILDALLEHSPLPMVFHDGSGAVSGLWLRKLADKIVVAHEQHRQPLAAAAPQPSPPSPAVVVPAPQPGAAQPQRVWVLGASFGGPEALKRFLGALHEVPPVALLIAQHIGDGFVDVLAAQLNRATPFRVVAAAEGMVLEDGCVYVAPVRERVVIDAQGRLQLQPAAARTGPTYMPSIDALMSTVAECYGADSGAIVFSGMGDDGAAGCSAIASAGGVVWAQDSGSCAIDSMPQCARATGAVRRTGSPEELAAAFVEHINACAQASARG